MCAVDCRPSWWWRFGTVAPPDAEQLINVVRKYRPATKHGYRVLTSSPERSNGPTEPAPIAIGSDHQPIGLEVKELRRNNDYCARNHACRSHLCR